MTRTITALLPAALLAALLVTAHGAPLLAQDLDSVEIKTIPITGGVYMLEGAGGNLGVSVGTDGVFLIDDQFAPLSEKIRAAILELSDRPIRFLVNTHWHFDHTGGNESFGKSGSVIVAHENVRKRMSVRQFMEAFQREVPAAPTVALPIITFTDKVTFHWNADEVRVIHVAPAHTDGDSIVHFVEANVIHAGDTFFNGLYPFIDVQSGGHLDGVIAAVERLLELTNAETKVIPGHGPLAGVAETREYQSMLQTVRDRIHALMAAGKSVEEIVAAKPTADFDEKWGKGFLAPDQWVGIVHQGMVAHGGSKQKQR